MSEAVRQLVERTRWLPVNWAARVSTGPHWLPFWVRRIPLTVCCQVMRVYVRAARW